MGLLISRFTELWSQWSTGPHRRILMLGLDAAGKTTILYKVKLNESISTIPTIGFNVEEVRPCPGVTFTVWDVGGQEKIRRLWQHYYANSEGLLFVVDSNDIERIGEARDELWGVLGADTMRGVPVVVMANKQDLPHALSTSDVWAKLGLSDLQQKGHREVFIQGTNANTGDGLYEAFDEMRKLSTNFVKQKKNYYM